MVYKLKEKKLKILFDLITTQYYPNMKFHGGGEYVKKIFFELSKKGLIDNLYFILSKKLETPKEIEELLKKEQVFFIEDGLKNIVIENNINRLYIGTIGNYSNIDFPKELEIIATIHDLRTLETTYDNTTFFYKISFKHKIFAIIYRIFKNNFYTEKYINNFRKIMYLKKYRNIYNHNNLRIITVSKHSKNMLKTQLSFLQNKEIKVFYSPEKSKIEKNLKNRYPFFYILLVSSNRMEKNNIRALVALDELISDGFYDGKIIVTGNLKLKKSFLKNVENFIFKDYVETEELESLYKNAGIFIYPTTTEGFGYPPLEAMKYGIPVISSAITATTEILGEAPLYFNPYSVVEIKARIYQMLTKKEQNYRKEKSLERYKKIAKKQNNDLEQIIKMILY